MIFSGIKYEPLSDPPVIKICEWGPWVFMTGNIVAGVILAFVIRGVLYGGR